VSSHSAAANGSRTDESASIRRIASPPGTHVSADERIDRVLSGGETAIVAAASVMATADQTARRRRRSTSTLRQEAPITMAGRATSAPIQSRASLIPFLAFLGHDRRVRRHDRLAQPPVETRQPLRGARERLHHDAVEDAVEKPALERDEV